MHSSTVRQQLMVSSRIVGICSSTKRRTTAVVGVHGQISANVGLVGAVPCYTEVDGTAKQAAVFQPDQQLVYCHPAGCVVASAQQHHQLALW